MTPIYCPVCGTKHGQTETSPPTGLTWLPKRCEACVTFSGQSDTELAISMLPFLQKSLNADVDIQPPEQAKAVA
jgi:hypothetical protein